MLFGKFESENLAVLSGEEGETNRPRDETRNEREEREDDSPLHGLVAEGFQHGEEETGGDEDDGDDVEGAGTAEFVVLLLAVVREKAVASVNVAISLQADLPQGDDDAVWIRRVEDCCDAREDEESSGKSKQNCRDDRFYDFKRSHEKIYFLNCLKTLDNKIFGKKIFLTFS